MTMLDFCPNCNEETLHESVVGDAYFKYGIQCLKCEVVFQAVDPNEPVQLEFDFEVDINAINE